MLQNLPMNTLLTFTGVDVGNPSLVGVTQQSPTGVEIIAGGEDIWGTHDQFHFAYTQVSGDFELSARIDSLPMADLYTKAGLMLRTALDSGAEHALLLAFGSNQPRNKNNGGLEFQSRTVANGACTGIYPPQPLPAQPDFPANFPNVWLKLSRAGDTLTGQYSQDGAEWKAFCVHQQHFPQQAYLGLAVTAHHATQTVKVVFSSLRFNQQA
jgi:hypothetical protein